MDSSLVRHGTPGGAVTDGKRIRAAELIAALSLATDLGIGVPLEHGLHSTLIAMRLVERAGIDAATASQTYYACLLFYVGCTANADLADELFGGHDVLTAYGGPARFGSRLQMLAGVMRAMAPPGGRVAHPRRESDVATAAIRPRHRGAVGGYVRGGDDADRPPRSPSGHREAVRARR